jgi:magnesium transporter
MSNNPSLFSGRRRILADRSDAIALSRAIRRQLAPERSAELRQTLDQQHPADLADAMLFLEPAEERTVFALLTTAEAAEVLDEVDRATEANLLSGTTSEALARILQELPADEGADVVGGLRADAAERVLSLTDGETARDIRALLAYPHDTAGGIMSLGYIDVPETATQAQAIARFREKRDADHIFYVYVVNAAGELLGTVDLRSLLNAEPETPVRDLMSGDLITVWPECDQEQVAAIFARYDLTALPVVRSVTDSRLLGVITADDIIDVIQEEASEDIAHLTGSDAEELEKKSPIEVAKLRLPWILSTMFIELLAGFVIRFFNPTLQRYLLLASFMPIISAISGNTGLQSAAIIIRGLSTGQIQLSHWRTALLRQVLTTIILAGVCAGSLGIIGGIWDGHWAFGLVVFLGMFLAVNIAGVVGTVVPLLSKRAGFDPALTAGPFETAFQDVVGISIFLSLASLLLRLLR